MAHGDTSFSTILLYIPIILHPCENAMGSIVERSGEGVVKIAKNSPDTPGAELAKISKLTKKSGTARYIKHLPRI
jgi:hypothetical protein